MPGPQAVVYSVVALASSNVPAGGVGEPGGGNENFNPGALPLPYVDGVNVANGQYFALTRQADPNQNGVWFADPAGPTPVPGATVGGGLNPNIEVHVGPGVAGSQNAGTTWVYTANKGNVVLTPGEGGLIYPGLVLI